MPSSAGGDLFRVRRGLRSALRSANSRPGNHPAALIVSHAASSTAATMTNAMANAPHSKAENPTGTQDQDILDPVEAPVRKPCSPLARALHDLRGLFQQRMALNKRGARHDLYSFARGGNPRRLLQLECRLL